MGHGHAHGEDHILNGIESEASRTGSKGRAARQGSSCVVRAARVRVVLCSSRWSGSSDKDRLV